MNALSFSTGGYVVHGMRVSGSPCKFSGWFEADGSLLDAERITRKCDAYPVTQGGFQWTVLATLGAMYRNREEF